jgi:hypothetical protein
MRTWKLKSGVEIEGGSGIEAGSNDSDIILNEKYVIKLI